MSDDIAKEIYNQLTNALHQPDSTGDLQLYLGHTEGVLSPTLPRLKIFAETVARLMTEPQPLVEQMEKLLAYLVDDQPPPHLPNPSAPAYAALLAYWQVALARPDWREDEVAKLQAATHDSRPGIRELALAALKEI